MIPSLLRPSCPPVETFDAPLQETPNPVSESL